MRNELGRFSMAKETTEVGTRDFTLLRISARPQTVI
jgi:hypothetical protein